MRQPRGAMRGDWGRRLAKLPTAFLEIGVLFVPGSELGSHLAAIDEESCAGDVRRLGGSQEETCLSHLLRQAPATERDVAEVFAEHFGAGEVALGEAGADESGADGVDANLIRPEL